MTRMRPCRAPRRGPNPVCAARRSGTTPPPAGSGDAQAHSFPSDAPFGSLRRHNPPSGSVYVRPRPPLRPSRPRAARTMEPHAHPPPASEAPMSMKTSTSGTLTVADIQRALRPRAFAAGRKEHENRRKRGQPSKLRHRRRRSFSAIRRDASFAASASVAAGQYRLRQAPLGAALLCTRCGGRGFPGLLKP